MKKLLLVAALLGEQIILNIGEKILRRLSTEEKDHEDNMG